MSFFISNAIADTTSAAAPAAANSFSFLLPLIILFVFAYFLILRPQAKRAKDQRNLISNLAKGDEVVTSGGLLGKISKLNDEFINLMIADDVEIKLQKSAITTVLPKGTLK